MSTRDRWRAAFVFGALAISPACGDGASSPEGPPPAPAQWFQGRLRQMPPWAEDLRRRRSALADGWPTEAWAESIERELPARILGTLGADENGLEAILADGFAGSTTLWPAEMAVAFDDAGLSVRRSERIDPTLHPRAALPDLARRWKESLREVRDPRVDLDVDGLTAIDDSRFETAIRLRISGTLGGGGALQQNIRWRARWSAPPPGISPDAPRLESLVVERCEEVRAKLAPFAELTRTVLSPADGFEEEILRGSGDYHLRQDRLSAQPYLGMHGLAVGDVDGDGLEDLYLPQPGGQPNRLLLHREDGTVEDAAQAAGLDVLDNCGPALILDLDNDGDQDVAVAAGSSILIGWNDGKGRFPDHTVLAGPDPPEVTSMSAADPDGDGDLDVYACRYAEGGVTSGAPTPYWNAENGERDLYWRNDGNRTFAEVSKEVGLGAHSTRFGLAVLWEDLDEDGDVDLYVVNDFGLNGYYRNDAGQFTEVGEAMGASVPAAGMGVSCADVDHDGNLDLFLTNMDTPAGSRIAANPRFLPDQPDLRPAYVRHTRGNTLLLGDGRGKFRDATDEAGVAPGGWAWGGSFFDLQNDGWSDLYVPNGFATGRDEEDLRGFFWRCVVNRSPRGPPATEEYVNGWDGIRQFSLFEGGSWNGRERKFAYLNLGGLRFAEAASALGVDFLDDGRLVAPMDWDDDGRVDLWLRNRTGPRLRFLRNVHPSPGHWIALDLAGTKCNRDAIGARVVVEASGVRTPLTVYAAQGFMAAPSRRLHFGLGAATKADRIEVRWPGGGTETFTDVPGDARYRIVQGQGSPERVEPRRHPGLAALPHEPVHVERKDVERIVLYERLPASVLELPSPVDAARTVASFRGKPLLVCVGMCRDPASRHLLQALAAKKRELEAIGAPLVALEAGEAAAEGEARALLEEMGLLELAGRASPRFLRAVEVFLVEVLGPYDRLAYPLALLFDRAGQLTVVYTGAPRIEVVLSDAALTRDLDPKGRLTEPLLRGRWAQPFARNLKGVARIFDLLGEAEVGRYYLGLARARAGR